MLPITPGLRRAGVTVATLEPDGQGFSKATRGYVRVLDRGGLADLARGIRGVPRAECARLLDDKVSPS